MTTLDEPATAIELSSFPFERLSQIAETESWRKEVHRPIYHVHKWWAQRLGSVFRGILVGALTPAGEDVIDAFYAPARELRPEIVFDPFMGSGTTIGEALKLGLRAVGRDINPVASFAVRTALTKYNHAEVCATFHAIERDVAEQIRHFYKARLPNGRSCDVLYYFWVKVVPCPGCAGRVRLFTSYVFAQHAYPTRNPEARILCPSCGHINHGRYDAEHLTCAGCTADFDPKGGPARGAKATCPSCQQSFPILAAVRGSTGPPEHELYAKLVLDRTGAKYYLAADEMDLRLYHEAEEQLAEMEDAYPVVALRDGANTGQAINYGYRWWHQFFNARQLVCLGLLGQRIRQVEDRQLRELFVCLFSGTLEFNNLFASYKGEGTGAVRHMFSHHILKPERMPLEANVWGTPKSSGAFSTLFRSRILRALEYQTRPFEVGRASTGGGGRSAKVGGLGLPMGQAVCKSFEELVDGGRLYLSTGDSAATHLPDASVDLVVTDPPFFDNVHYSELADFFYVWQRHLLGTVETSGDTTRHAGEVQSEDAEAFTDKLTAVLRESARVLQRAGLLIFTYHHSRVEGWSSVLLALRRTGLVVVAAHPVKAEMSVAAPKTQASSPIDVDVILVCRHRDAGLPNRVGGAGRPESRAAEQVERMMQSGRALSRNDVRVVLMAQVLAEASRHHMPVMLEPTDATVDALTNVNSEIRRNARRAIPHATAPVMPQQLSLVIDPTETTT